MNEPEIISYGRNFIGEYTAQEFKDSLIRAFKEKQVDYIVLDDNPRGLKFVAACAAWAMDKGWLYNNNNEDDGQQKVFSFRLTEAGKKAILKVS